MAHVKEKRKDELLQILEIQTNPMPAKDSHSRIFLFKANWAVKKSTYCSAQYFLTKRTIGTADGRQWPAFREILAQSLKIKTTQQIAFGVIPRRPGVHVVAEAEDVGGHEALEEQLRV
ncbi:hypothetical protein EVAR_46692_1 [Eumeta japonica]|uniref:Uncharacterized protein n=1 Tax=Eumeta variegata TaxID=151549 RepID=A0A4C1Y6M0_EUMVA|nr:hypothetical protein EVAR_46692_1 [Eumeta japonica]